MKCEHGDDKPDKQKKTDGKGDHGMSQEPPVERDTTANRTES